MQVTIYSAHAFEKNYLGTANTGHTLRFLSESLSLETALLARGSQAVLLFTQDDASAPVLEILKALGVQYISTRSAGYDHIDVSKAHALGLKVARVPAYSPFAIAEHAVALIMALNRKLILAHELVNRNNYCLDQLIGFDMHGKTVGIVGLGRIGRVTAKILYGFGCRILGYDVAPPTQLEVPVELVPLPQLLAQSDIVTLHAPLNELTHYLMRAETLSMMKKGAMLINTSRGALVNTQDLITALQSGQIGAAGLDVYEKEKAIFFKDLSGQPPQDELLEELKGFSNVLITGHQAFLTSTALQNIAATTMHNLTCWENSTDSLNEIK